MHLSQGFTYHLSILQFLHALAAHVDIKLCCLDAPLELKTFFVNEFGEPLNPRVEVVQIAQRRYGLKSNRIWFFRNVLREIKALIHANIGVTIYTRNVKQMAQFIDCRDKWPQAVRCVFECHQLYSQNLAFCGDFQGGQREYTLERKIQRRADCVFVNTKPLADHVQRLFQSQPRILPVATRARDLVVPDLVADRFRSRAYDFVYAGSFVAWKGVDVLFEALGIMARNGWAGRALCVGVREHEFEDVRAQLQAAGAQDHVTLHGRVARHEIAGFLDQARIGVLPNSLIEDSVFNTSPLKLFDYAARGLHICATRLPALDGVMDGEAIFWARPDDAVDLARSLLAASEHANEMNLDAIDWVGQFTWEKRAHQVAIVLDHFWGHLVPKEGLEPSSP